MRKKASLSLSVNAIIVLILAIVMLGLGLAFIRGMFGKVSVQVGQQVSNEPEPAVPSGFRPITLSRESIITHSGEKEIMKVGVFNPSGTEWDNVEPQIKCSGTMGSITSEANQKTIGIGKHAIFTLTVNIPASVPNTYLCQMEMRPTSGGVYQQDFTIKISE